MFKYNKLKFKDITENGISVTKISKFTPTISLDVFKTPRDEKNYKNLANSGDISLKSVVSTPIRKNVLEPGNSFDITRRSSEETRFSKSSARSFSEVFENLNELNLEKLSSEKNKVVNSNGIVVEPIVTSIQSPSIQDNVLLDIKNLNKDKIVNKTLQKVKPSPQDRMLKKIDSSIIMFYGEPIYNITQNSSKPGEFKL